MGASRAVLWDLDGTLIDSEELHWLSWRDTMADEGIAIPGISFFPHLVSVTTPLFQCGWVLRRLLNESGKSRLRKRSGSAV